MGKENRGQSLCIDINGCSVSDRNVVTNHFRQYILKVAPQCWIAQRKTGSFFLVINLLVLDVVNLSPF